MLLKYLLSTTGATPEPAHADSTLLMLNEHTKTNNNTTKADFIFLDCFL
jgi:hypothetical protein